MVFMLWYNYGIAFETKATIRTLLAWCIVTWGIWGLVSDPWKSRKKKKRIPKNRHVAYSSMHLARINPNDLSMLLSLKTPSFSHHLVFTYTHARTHARLTLELQTASVHAPWHWQRSNSEFLQLKNKIKSRNMSMIASWIAWLWT